MKKKNKSKKRNEKKVRYKEEIQKLRKINQNIKK